MKLINTLPILALLALFPLTACAGKAPGQESSMVQYSGNLPTSGRVTLRSGLAWTNEGSPLVMISRQAMQPILQDRGLILVEAPHSSLEAMPNTSFSPGATGVTAKKEGTSINENTSKEKALALSQAGKLPKAVLQRYDIPAHDANLPASVMALKPLDPYAVLFAFSQQEGTPIMYRGGAIPGRLPLEITSSDPTRADYAIIVRFAAVQPMPARSYFGGATGLGGTTGTGGSGGVRGIPSLGYGTPAASLPPPPTYGGSPIDYARGYVGPNNDPWGRQHDMNARDYFMRISPPPPVASIPEGHGPLDKKNTPMVAPSYLPGGMGMAPAEANATTPNTESSTNIMGAASGVMIQASGFALELECYSLIPVREGQPPLRIWSATVHQRADGNDLAQALPGMIQQAFKNLSINKDVRGQ